jgi:hypothetical protein
MLVSHYEWVLRCSITGEPFASQTESPENPEFPVQWNESECYWAFEKFFAEPSECELCSAIGGYCGHCDGSHWSR